MMESLHPGSPGTYNTYYLELTALQYTCSGKICSGKMSFDTQTEICNMLFFGYCLQ